MSYMNKFTEATGEKFRATTHLNTDENGIEEWRAVVDRGELESYEKNIGRLKELIRPLFRSDKCYQFFMKDDEIINFKWFKPVFKDKKKKIRKDKNASRPTRQPRTK